MHTLRTLFEKMEICGQNKMLLLHAESFFLKTVLESQKVIRYIYKFACDNYRFSFFS